MITEQMSEGLSIAAAPVHAQQAAAGTQDSGGIDMQKFERALFVVDVGAFGASATVDAKLQESADNVTFTDLANAAVTQLAAAGGNNRLVTLECRAGQLSSGKRYVRCRVTVGTAATYVCVLPLGGDAHQKPASAQDVTAVAQRLVL